MENHVIIIGSGPAGCAAAITCIKAGLHPLMFTEQSVHITEGTSGILESIHPGVSTILQRIGLQGVETKATRGHYRGIQVGNHFTPLGEDEDGPWHGMHVDRLILHQEMLRTCIDAGVEVIPGQRIDSFLTADEHVTGVLAGAKEFHTHYVIDASGKAAIAGKKLKFRRKFFSPPLVCWTGVSGCTTFPVDSHAAHFIPHTNGWTWLAPQPPDRCGWTMLSTKGAKSFLPPKELKDCTVIGQIEADNRRWRSFRPVCREGIVLCGDAAGILDPAAGQGIFNALLSGMTAAQCVVSCLQQPDLEAIFLAKYDAWFVNQFEEKVLKLTSYYQEHGISLS